MNCRNAVNSVLSVNRAARGFGDAEINHLRHRHDHRAHRHQNVRRLDVAMDDALLMRVLNRLADLDEQVSRSRVSSWFSSQ
jgi:hypothetical protein